MAQSHGMSPQDHAKFLFDQQLEELALKERPYFLFEKVGDFVQRFEYRGGDPIGETDVWIAVHAAEVLLGDDEDSKFASLSSRSYLLEKFVDIVAEVARKSGQVVDTGKISAALEKIKTEKQSPSQDLDHVSKPGETNTPTFRASLKPATEIGEPELSAGEPRIRTKPYEIKLEDFQIQVTARVNKPNSVNLEIFPRGSKDNAYTSDLKVVARRFFDKGNFHVADRELNRLVVKMNSKGKSKAEVHRDVEAVIRSGFEQLARIISNPKSFAQRDVSNTIVRGLAFARLVQAIRKVEDVSLNSEAILSKGKEAYEYFHTPEFVNIALDQLDQLLRNPTDGNLEKAWNVRKIAVAVGNSDLETLASLAYAYYHKTNDSEVSMKPKMTKGLTSQAIEVLPSEILNRTAMNGATWKEMAIAVIPCLKGFDPNQGAVR